MRVLLVALLSLLLLGCAGSATPAAATEAPPPTETVAPTAEAVIRPIRTVCFVLDGGSVNDGTYNQFIYEGMVRAADDMDLLYDDVETTPEDDYLEQINKCLVDDYEVIITAGAGRTEPALAAAAANPGTYFIAVDLFGPEVLPPNMAVLQYREDEAGFLAGALACMMTESDIVGGVYGIDFAPLKRFRYGFENGCHYVNPDAETLGIFMESFTDPAAGADAAEAFVAEGADVIFGAAGATGSGAIREAARDVLVIGVDQDEYLTTFSNGSLQGSERLLTSAIKQLDEGVYQQIQALAQPGSIPWQGGGFYTLNVGNGGIDYAPFHETESVIPAAVVQRLEEIKAALADGSLTTGVDFATGEPDPATIPEPVPFVP